jgi:PAS domain S-box-containing protein
VLSGATHETLRVLPQGDFLFGTLFRSASIGVKIMDMQTHRILDANPAYQRLLGYTVEELRSRPYAELTHPEDRARERALQKSVVEGKTDTFRLVKRYVHKGGASVWARVTASVVRDGDGIARYGVSMVEDVSDERAALKAISDADERNRLIVETTSEGIWVIDAESCTTFANEAMASMLGYTVAEMLGRSVFDFVDDEGARHSADLLTQRHTGVSERVAKRYKRADGTMLEAMLCRNALFGKDGDYIGAVAIVSDMTELRRSEDSVSARVRQLETIAELGRDILAGLSLDHLLDRVGSSVARALDTDRVAVMEVLEDGRVATIAAYGWDGAIGNTIPAHTSQAGYQISTRTPRLIIEDMLQERRFVPSSTLIDGGVRGGLSCLIEGDEEPFGVLTAHTYAPRSFTDEDSNFLASVAHLIGSVIRRDRIASLGVQAEEELRRTAERFRMIADNSQDIIYRLRVGEDAGYDYMSPVVTSILGVTPEDFYADPDLPLKYLHEDDVESIANSRVSDEQSGALLVRWHHPDGRLLWIERRTRHFHGEDGKPFVIEGIIRDVTERVEQDERRRSLEEQLRQSQRLEAIGQLAGGIAHDFNNLLLALRGYGDLALRRLERGDMRVEDDIAEMLDATDRATALTNQLLAFARRQVLAPEVIDLCEVVKDMDRLLRQLIGEQVELVAVHGDEPILVEVDRSQLEQVIANLAVNAGHAMAEGGRLAIEVVSDRTGHAVLSVTDTGCGMDDQTAARIFEPFFTTKGENGTGLGLATVHGIVSQSGGRISVASEPGNGTTFRVFLPLAEGVPAPAAVLLQKAAGGAESILVIEDEPMVRTIVTAMLEDRGYNVVAVDGSEAAIATVSASTASFDLVLSDLVMPGLNGRQTVGCLRELGCDAKVLYMSGYADEVLLGGPLDPATALLQKPFDGDALARQVRATLDQGNVV